MPTPGAMATLAWPCRVRHWRHHWRLIRALFHRSPSHCYLKALEIRPPKLLGIKTPYRPVPAQSDPCLDVRRQCVRSGRGKGNGRKAVRGRLRLRRSLQKRPPTGNRPLHRQALRTTDRKRRRSTRLLYPQRSAGRKVSHNPRRRATISTNYNHQAAIAGRIRPPRKQPFNRPGRQVYYCAIG